MHREYPPTRAGQIPRWLLPVLALALTLYRCWAVAHLGLDAYVDEAYYWGWSQTLDWGYYSKPPMIAGLIAASGWLFGDHLLALKAPSLILYPATALVIEQLGRRMFGDPVGFWSGLAFLSMPLISVLGLFVSTDAPLLFFWALGMKLIWSMLDRENQPATGLWAALGVTLGLGLMSKYTMAAFAGSALLALLAHPGGARQLGRPGPWLALAIALALFAPNLWWNWRMGFPTFQHTAEITRVAGAGGDRGWHPDQLLEFTAAQWLSFGPLLSFGLAGALLGLRGLWVDLRCRFLLLFLLPLLLLVSVQALTGRANGNWAAPIFVSASLLTVAFLSSRYGHSIRWRLAVAGVALNLAAAFAAYHWPDLLRATGREPAASNDPFKRVRGWRELADSVRPHLQAHPDAVLVSNDRELMAQLIYGLRPARHARWQDQPHIEDQYGLTTPLTPESGQTFLVVLPAQFDPAPVIARFASAEKLADADVTVYPTLHRRASVWLMKGFAGYR